MVAEASYYQRTEHRARLYSPIYSPSDSMNASFQFYYHMFGFSVGRLRVYVKPLTADFREYNHNLLKQWIYFISSFLLLFSHIYFERQGSQKDRWIEANIALKPLNESFQIIFEASGDTNINNIYDIAVDDVFLINHSNIEGNFISESKNTKNKEIIHSINSSFDQMQLTSRSEGRIKDDSNESEAGTDFDESNFSNEEIIFPTQEKHTEVTSIPSSNHLYFIIPTIIVIIIFGISFFLVIIDFKIKLSNMRTMLIWQKVWFLMNVYEIKYGTTNSHLLYKGILPMEQT